LIADMQKIDGHHHCGLPDEQKLLRLDRVFLLMKEPSGDIGVSGTMWVVWTKYQRSDRATEEEQAQEADEQELIGHVTLNSSRGDE